MDLLTAENRARIACRIYLKLFDAGDGFDGRDGGAIIVFDEIVPEHTLGASGHDTVRDVLNNLERVGAVFRSDGSRPLFYRLDDAVRSMMANHYAVDRQATKTVSFADRVREELAWFDAGNASDPPNTFTKLEPIMRAYLANPRTV